MVSPSSKLKRLALVGVNSRCFLLCQHLRINQIKPVPISVRILSHRARARTPTVFQTKKLGVQRS